MRIGPKSELMTGGLRTSPALRDFPHGSRDSWQHLRALQSPLSMLRRGFHAALMIFQTLGPHHDGSRTIS